MLVSRAERLTWSLLPIGLQALLTEHASTVFDAQQDAAGNAIVFSTKSALLSQDNNSHSDIYLYDVNSETLRLLSVGLDNQAGNRPSDRPRLDAFGRELIYRSTATNLIGGAQNTHAQLYHQDLCVDAISRLTRTPEGEPGDGESGQALWAGEWVIYRTEAANMAPEGVGLYRQRLDDNTRQPIALDEWGKPDSKASNPAADAMGQQIVYQRPEADNGVHIYLTDTWQAKRISLLDDPHLGRLNHCCAAISPDGLYIAYREQDEQERAWLHVCSRCDHTCCDYQRLPWPDEVALRHLAPQFSDDGGALWWVNPE
jgi:Tol biopolymer transport system component